MLKAATINGAYANHLENEIGTLEIGKKADIVVLSANLFEISTEAIPDVEILMTFFEGVLVYDSTSTGVESETSNPALTILNQNYPNPFNSTTSIQFSLPANQNINLSIFNIRGHIINTIYQGYMAAGQHTIEYSAGPLPAGMYFYKIETENSTEVKKMILL